VTAAAGFVNAHTHLYSGLVPLGMPAPERPPTTFLEILERVWWRLDRALDERSLAAAARYYVVDALAAGTAALVDHHESPRCIEGSLDVLADVCAELGMPALLCYGATERNGGRDEARRGLAECRRFIRANTRPAVRGLVGLHASFTVSDDTIREAGALCRDLDTVLHVHVAEAEADVADARARGYPGPLERLRDLGALVPGSVLAHGVHLSAAQAREAERLGCWLVQNPRSNRGNGVGYAAHLGTSRRVALGTDGYRSDMLEELAVLRGEAQAHGDACRPDQRLAAGRVLMEERFGVLPAAGGRAIDRAAIAAAAADEARRLWRRMEAV
jgi:cytosine/adenosine deaminase-related metal-dependent hydrolase